MARKTKTIVITADNRDLGKNFLLTEMSSVKAEAWGMRALLALANGGVEIPDEFASAGLAGLAAVGVQALGRLQYEAAAPLLAEMLDQVQIVPDPQRPMVTRSLIEDDVEEVSTLFQLRKEILALHVDFFTDAGLLKRVQGALGRGAESSPSPT